MNVDEILATMNRHQVRYLLIGGMNFLLRHAPVLTYDIDLWIDDTPENRNRCEAALGELGAEWGASDADWKPVSAIPAGWLANQPLFCLTSREGAIDVFRYVAGLEHWQSSFTIAVPEKTAQGTPYWGLSDADMLRCQLALQVHEQKSDRISALQAAIDKSGERR